MSALQQVCFDYSPYGLSIQHTRSLLQNTLAPTWTRLTDLQDWSSTFLRNV